MPCRLCGADDFSLLHRTRGGLGSFDGRITEFLICERCGLVANARGDMPPDFYETEYYDRSSLSLFRTTPAAVERLGELLGPAAEDLNGGLLVDMGCGAGSTVAALSVLFPKSRVLGVEPDPFVAADLRAATASFPDIEIRSGRLESFRPPPRVEISGLFLLTVFEHLPEPGQALDRCHRLIRRDGWLFLSVPDVMEPGPFGLDYLFRHFHLFYYSDRTISAMLQSHGFVPEAIFRGEDYRCASGPAMFVRARRVDRVVDARSLVGPEESGRIRGRLRRVDRITRWTGPVRWLWRYRIRRPMLKRLAAARRAFRPR